MFSKKQFVLFVFFISLFAKAQQKPVSAYALIEKTLGNSTQNIPDNLEFTSYNKLIVSANPDSISGRIDSVFVTKKNKRVFQKIDSSDFVFKKIIRKQHLYQTEKISKFKLANHLTKETILATRMAGFKEPVYEYFSLQLQPFSLYEPTYTIVEKEYINPISKKGLHYYNFKFVDSTNLENRKIYQIDFSPKTKTKADQLTGSFFVDAKNYNIAKAQLRVLGLLKIVCNYEFNFNSTLNNWFTSKKTLSIKKGNNKYPIKIFGETITFEGTANENKIRKYASDFIEINSTTKTFDPKFNLTSKIPNRDIAIKINESAISKKDDSWYSVLNDTIDERTNPTYVSIDSLVGKRKIEKKLLIGRKIIQGFYPVRFFDIDARYLLKYNNFEGFRLGFGGMTNEKLSKTFKIEANIAYGTKDNVIKGALSGMLRLGKLSETWTGISYTDDLKEIASTAFEIDKRDFKFYDSRPINISTFYDTKTWKIFLETKIIPKTRSIFQVSHSVILPRFEYEFLNNQVAYTQYKVVLATASFQWNPYSKFMQTPSQKIEFENNFPKFSFQVSKTVPKILENDFDFWKLDYRVNYEKKFNSGNKILLLFEGGIALGDVPITHVYNHTPNNLKSNDLFEKATLAGTHGFETMFFNEFFSNKYVFLQGKYQFPEWELSISIKPVFSIVTRLGWGNLDESEKHKIIDFKTLENGFYESGIEINKIYKGFGFVTYYRYGPNHLPDFRDNIALNLSFEFDLGF
jgi:hypothetical protein